MIIFRFKADESNSIADANEIYKNLITLFPNEQVIGIPTAHDIQFNATIEDLIAIRDFLNKTIQENKG